MLNIILSQGGNKTDLVSSFLSVMWSLKEIQKSSNLEAKTTVSESLSIHQKAVHVSGEHTASQIIPGSQHTPHGVRPSHVETSLGSGAERPRE